MSEPLTKYTGHLVEAREWTAEKPTEPGWYWWRKNRRIGTCRVRKFDIANETFMAGYQWSGPIPLPTDAPAQDWYKAEDVNRITECLHHLLVYVKGIEQPFKDAFESEYRMPSVITDAQTLFDQLRKGRG